MPIGPRLEFRQSQSLVMTPQLRQAIKLLQFSNLEVAAFVEEELERNPLLDRDERPEVPPERPSPEQPERALLGDDAPLTALVALAALPDAQSAPLDVGDDGDTFGADEAARAAETYGGAGAATPAGSAGGDERGIDELVPMRASLREHLGEQLRLTFADRAERLIGAHLIALLEPSGRLSAAPAAVAAALGIATGQVEAVRARMMAFDPVGMFARSLAECLAAQLREANRLDPCMARLLDNLELLARREHRQLCALCEVDQDDLAGMIAEIRALDPKPGANWNAAAIPPVVPDVLMRAAPRRGRARPGLFAEDEAAWILELNPETMPRVLVNEAFATRVVRGCQAGAAATAADREARAFVSERLATANWLIKSLQQRAQTILRVAAEIVRRQDGFFAHGVSHLRPLILRDIADAVSLHESTVSRVTANKYIATPRGVFELKYFFTTAIAGAGGATHSAEAVRHRIRALVGLETADDILSDDALVAALRQEGVDIARRTVAKYREALRIPSSVQRKREKAVPA